MEDEYLLIGEAAKLLGVCKKTLYNWHLSGKLVPEVHPITRIRLYKRSEVEHFLNDYIEKDAQN